jgi:putative spermidine/putrescine transport system substrate-binding protein
MSSLEEITKFDSEKSNPVAVMADIGLLYGPVAEKRGVVPAFLPPEAAKLPAGFKAATGGWVGTFTGVPAFVVNTDVVKNVPQTWNDLLKPEYKGLINASNPATSGTGATTFLAWAYAGGGSTANLAPGVEFGKQFVGQLSSAEGNAASLEKGEVPIQIKYDFNCVAAAEAVKAKGVNAIVIIPGVSIYAPSALMLNKYNTAKMDLAKLFASYVLGDEGQTLFASFGARPVRYVLGDLTLPDTAKAKWLKDDQYAKVQLVDDWTKVDPELIATTWKNQVLGG